MIYGAGGAILTRAGSSIAQGFVPSTFASSPLAIPAVQAILAVTAVRWVGKKFLGQRQADLMMGGGLISAGLALADQYLPNIQGQLTGFLQAPLGIGQQTAAPALAGYRDVYDVTTLPGSFAGLGDVEDVPLGIFS